MRRFEIPDAPRDAAADAAVAAIYAEPDFARTRCGSVSRDAAMTPAFAPPAVIAQRFVAAPRLRRCLSSIFASRLVFLPIFRFSLFFLMSIFRHAAVLSFARRCFSRYAVILQRWRLRHADAFRFAASCVVLPHA